MAAHAVRYAQPLCSARSYSGAHEPSGAWVHLFSCTLVFRHIVLTLPAVPFTAVPFPAVRSVLRHRGFWSGIFHPCPAGGNPDRAPSMKWGVEEDKGLKACSRSRVLRRPSFRPCPAAAVPALLYRYLWEGRAVTLSCVVENLGKAAFLCLGMFLTMTALIPFRRLKSPQVLRKPSPEAFL